MHQWIELRPLIAELLISKRSRILRQHIKTEIDIDPNVSMWCIETICRQALGELLQQSIDAMPGGGEMLITAVSTAAGIEIEFADSGHGLDTNVRSGAEYLAHFRLRGVRNFVITHGAHVDAINCPDGGTAITLCVPLSSMKAAA